MPQPDHIVREAHGPEAERPEQGDEQPCGQLIFLLLDAERPQQRRHQIPERRREDEPQR